MEKVGQRHGPPPPASILEYYKESRLATQDNWQELLADMHGRHAGPPAPKRPAPADLHLTNDQRQGRWCAPDPNMDTVTRRRLLSERVNIHMDPCNPDLDIHPPGKYTIQVGTRTAGEQPTGTDSDFAHVLQPHGQMARQHHRIAPAHAAYTVQTCGPHTRQWA